MASTTASLTRRVLPRQSCSWLSVILCLILVRLPATIHTDSNTQKNKRGVEDIRRKKTNASRIFSLGANTLTFIIPAEIFPTSYRCLCHGISAAAGKLGSIVAVLVVYGINSGYASATRQGLVFLLFATFMALGAVYSWAYLPDVQRRTAVQDDDAGGGRRRKLRLETKNLEELGEGYMRARLEGQVIGLRNKWDDLKERVRERRGRRIMGSGGEEREEMTTVAPVIEDAPGRGRIMGPVEADGRGVSIA